jgi:hypothetical protein
MTTDEIRKWAQDKIEILQDRRDRHDVYQYERDQGAIDILEQLLSNLS